MYDPEQVCLCSVLKSAIQKLARKISSARVNKLQMNSHWIILTS